MTAIQSKPSFAARQRPGIEPTTPHHADAGNCSQAPQAAAPDSGTHGPCVGPEPYHPLLCETYGAAGIPDTLAESLVLKYLLAHGVDTGRSISRTLCLPGKSTMELLTDLKGRQLLVYKNQAAMGDFEYTLTDAGRALANRYIDECAYCGPAPVPLKAYIDSVHAQTIKQENPGPTELREAFSDLLINDAMIERLGPAINSGKGLFLFGFPGNGKTSIAERITNSFGTPIWIPFTILVDGEIIQLFDPQNHEPIGTPGMSIVKGETYDPRWIKIRRPTIMVGGELRMSALELRHDPNTKITEAPLQLKSNCGTLVIDDFGRQTMNPDELLNRWIVPLEKRYDYLALNSGKKMQVPFDQLIVFSTNLEPKELVDDAFLRRIPYKINIVDPTEAEFRKLFRIMAEQYGMAMDEAALEHLIEHHYRVKQRPFRSCQPRDLLMQIIDRARFLDIEPVMSADGFDIACENYFTLI